SLRSRCLFAVAHVVDWLYRCNEEIFIARSANIAGEAGKYRERSEQISRARASKHRERSEQTS
ncbi:MAG: hypothetical protein KDG51_02195, partial [Calditrichaeota bacterium]|nr:hypothetical protein [Calditrichota bacterium]